MPLETLTARPNSLSSTDSHAREVARGERFEFGENWARFLKTLNEPRIVAATRALQRMLEVDSLQGLRFLDIGSGSGLSSLAARRLGAQVLSFDFDPQSVACTRELRRRYFPTDDHWRVEQGSILDRNYVRSLGAFDVVYSWGVLHHTGRMWDALDHAAYPVGPAGKLFVAIYNDTGSQSRRWRSIKRLYNRLPRVVRPAYALAVSAPAELKAAARSLLALRPGEFVRSWTGDLRRGMSRWHDLIDWVGGYPYEFAKPEEIFDFYRARGFSLMRMACGGVGLGCNQFVFERQTGR